MNKPNNTDSRIDKIFLQLSTQLQSCNAEDIKFLKKVENIYITTNVACEILEVSKTRILYLCAEGRIECIKKLNKYQIRLISLFEFNINYYKRYVDLLKKYDINRILKLFTRHSKFELNEEKQSFIVDFAQEKKCVYMIVELDEINEKVLDILKVGKADGESGFRDRIAGYRVNNTKKTNETLTFMYDTFKKHLLGKNIHIIKMDIDEYIQEIPGGFSVPVSYAREVEKFYSFVSCLNGHSMMLSSFS